MKRTESTLSADDGAAIFLRHWAPDDGARGAVQVAHGLAEHSRRYEAFGEALADAGYLVYASDHRGHGRTADAERDVGFFAERDGWDRVLADLRIVEDHVAATHPDLPRALVGHSMGSFLALETMLRRPSAFGAVVLSATKKGGGALPRAGLVAAGVERLRVGRRGRSKVLQFLSFGTYNLPFRPNRTEFDWLSRDAAEVDDYVLDPRCGFDATTQLWIDLLGGVVALGDTSRFAALPRGLPMLLIAGSDDPVANQAPPVEALHEALQGAGLSNARLRRYPGGRHELFHETNRDEVFADVVAFLDEALAR